jgi:pimeloyl-ACP methyl ester carboxylesterase/lysophospholipase L1-like esterase
MKILLCLLFFIPQFLLQAAAPRVAILGDSITFGGRWPTLVESALRGTPTFAEAEIVNFGLSSETVSGLSEKGHAGGKFPRPDLHERLERILDEFKPTHVLACYGMNDGIYLPLDDTRQQAYQDGMIRLKAAVEKRGAQWVGISAPLHDGDHPSQDAQRYDAVLDAQAAWLSSQKGWQVIDIRHDLRTAVAEAKQKNPAFVYAGDKVHPGSEGHDFIAASVVRQLWTLWKLPGKPVMATGQSLALLSQRSALLKLAWLTKTRHTRPGVPKGLPIEEAEAQAEKLLQQYRAASAPSGAQWNGYDRIDFKVSDRAAWLVKPKQVAAGSPWIWRTEFFGHEPQADIALLEKGFHVAYINVQNLYGAPIAMKAMDDYYAKVTAEFGLSKRCVLEGFSRGGLFAFNWAALRPEQVAGLYVDAPVCDFKSWPGGKGKGSGSKGDWKRLLEVYGLTEEQALAYKNNPIDVLAPMAKAKIPILAVVGSADDVVPVEENIDVVEKRYLALGGKITVIRKPGVKHHPHSLKDPAPIVEFVLSVYR